MTLHGLLLLKNTTTIPGQFLAMDMNGTLRSTTMEAADVGVLAQQVDESLCHSFHDHFVPNEDYFGCVCQGTPKDKVGIEVCIDLRQKVSSS
jgi:hypothetical protein